MSIYNNWNNRAEARTRVKAVQADNKARKAEEAARADDLARVLNRLKPLDSKDEQGAAEALESELTAIANRSYKSDPKIIELDSKLDELRHVLTEKKGELQGRLKEYQAQRRQKDRELAWEERLEKAGLSHVFPRSSGSLWSLRVATPAVAALELALLGPPMTSLIRNNAPSWSSLTVGIAAATVVSVFVGCGAATVIGTGRQYKDYKWASAAVEIAEELNKEVPPEDRVPVEKPQLGSVIFFGLVALLVQSFLFVMRFIAEDSSGQFANLSVAVSGVATTLPATLLLLEYRVHDPKHTSGRSYEQEDLDNTEKLQRQVSDHIPRQLRWLEAERERRKISLQIDQVEAIRSHAMSLDGHLLKILDLMAYNLQLLETRIREQQRTEDERTALAEKGDLILDGDGEDSHGENGRPAIDFVPGDLLQLGVGQVDGALDDDGIEDPLDEFGSNGISSVIEMRPAVESG